MFIVPHILEDFIRPALPEFARRYPTVTFTFARLATRAEARKEVLAGKLDGVLMTVDSEREIPGSVFLADVDIALYGSTKLLKRAGRDGLAAAADVTSGHR